MTSNDGAQATPDIRLIATDMDGTLLDDDHELHEHFWPLIHELHARGILFCPASGRQYYNLLERFEAIADEIIFVAENGTFVVHRGVELSSTCVSVEDAREVVSEVRRLTASADVGAVICGKRSAYIERTDGPFVDQCMKYYARLEIVEDLLAVQDDVLKVAVFDFGNSADTTAPALAHFDDRLQVVVSGQHWVDVMSQRANKGVGLGAIQQRFGISPAQTMVFGDFLNDLEMMDFAEHSYAMANAHPDLIARARHVAPPNTENGVVRTIAAVLGLDLPE